LIKWNGEKWIQLNEKSDFSANISELSSRLDTAEASIENHGGRIASLEEIVGEENGESGSILTRVAALETLVGTEGENDNEPQLTKDLVNDVVDLTNSLGAPTKQDGETTTPATGLYAEVEENASAIDTLDASVDQL
jgi:hypothetical protein